MHLTQKQLADLVNEAGVRVSDGRIGQIEGQDWVVVSDELCHALSKVLKVNIYDLMNDSKVESANPFYLLPIDGEVPRRRDAVTKQVAKQGYLEVLASQLEGSKENDLFVVRAKGNDFVPDGLLDGMWVIVDRKARINDGDIALVQFGDLIQFRHVYWGKGKICLVAGGHYRELGKDDVEIKGKVVLFGNWSRPAYEDSDSLAYYGTQIQRKEM